MIKQYFDIDDGKWGVILCYDYGFHDIDDMAALMYAFGLTERRIRNAIRTLMHDNTGMTISRDDLKMSIVFISNTTTPEEWWDTLNHELLHVGTAIIDYYNEPYNQEPAAYLQGHLMKRIVKRVGIPCKG